MPSGHFDYYAQVADRMLPFLTGRLIAVEQQFPGSEKIVYRRHTGARGRDTWIRISNRDDLLEWARKYATAFHAHVLSEDRGAWFVIDIDSRGLPLEMARIAAELAVDVLCEHDLDPLVKFSGSDGFHLMFDVPDLGGLPPSELWALERELVRSVACEVEKWLIVDPRAQPIRAAVGEGKPLIATANADHDNANALLFDEYILKDNANFRVPFSLHPKTGLAAAPLTRAQLASFEEEDASPQAVAAGWPDVPLPSHSIAQVKRALASWHAAGC